MREVAGGRLAVRGNGGGGSFQSGCWKGNCLKIKLKETAAVATPFALEAVTSCEAGLDVELCAWTATSGSGRGRGQDSQASC